MKRRHLYPCVLLIFVMTGCATVGNYAAIATSAGVTERYYAVLDRWTRSGAVYSEFETNLRIVSTLKSNEFDAAYVNEYMRAYETTEKSASRVNDAVAATPAGSLDFCVYVYMPDKRSNNLESAQSIWKLLLISGEDMTATPTEIREEEITPATEKLFPYVNKYHGKFYRVRFPYPGFSEASPAEGGLPAMRIRLVCAGFLGRTEMAWEIPVP